MKIFYTTNRLVLLLVLAFISPFFANSQAFQWVKKAGGNLNDVGLAVTVDSSSNVYIAGYFGLTAGFGNDSITSAGNYDVYVAKYTEAGTLQWVRQAGGGGDDIASDIIADANGNTYVTGYFTGAAIFGDDTLISQGAGEIFLAKYTSSGICEWAVSAGGASDDGGNSLCIDAAGNIYITGSFTGTANFGSNAIDSYGATDIFVAKCNTNGIWQWVQKAGSSNWDNGIGISIDDSDNLYLTGYFSEFWGSPAHFGSYDLYSSGSYDLYTAKCDNSGNFLWAVKGGGTYLDVGNDIITDASGNSFVIGYFSGTAAFGTQTLTSDGPDDYFIAKYDTYGNLTWLRQAGGTGYYKGNGISIDRNNNVFLTGTFGGTAVFGDTTLTSMYADNIFILKYDDYGNFYWAHQAKGSYYHIAQDIRSQNGDAFITGTLFQNAWFDCFFIYSEGSYNNYLTSDIFIAKLNDFINTSKSIGSSPFCAGENVSVPFTADYDFGPSNVFTAQLSDLTGCFDDAVTIGTLTGTGSGTINATIPQNTATGTTYRIRIVSSNPYIIGSDNGFNLTVNPAVIAEAGNDTIIIVGDSIQLGSNPISDYTYLWNPGVVLSDSTIANPWAKPIFTSTFKVTVQNNFGCITYDSVTIYVSAEMEFDSTLGYCGYSPERCIYYNSQSARDSIDAILSTRQITYPCGDHFNLTFMDNGTGFDDAVLGPQRRDCVCSVFEYLESTFDIPTGTEINILFLQSGPISGAPGALAAAYPFFQSDFDAGYPGIYGGDIFDKIVNNFDNDPYFNDGHIQVNFDDFNWATCSFPIDICQYDLYSVILHEALHAFGFISLVQENSTLVPVPATGYNQFSVFDWSFLYHGDIYSTIYEKLITGSLSSPEISSSLLVPGTLRDAKMWTHGTGRFTNNQPIYSGGVYLPGYLFLPGSFLSHLDGNEFAFTFRGWVSPGYIPHYAMSPFFCKGESRKEITIPEIRMLLEMDYDLTNAFATSTSTSYDWSNLNGDIIENNHPPYTTKQTTRSGYSGNPYPDILQLPDHTMQNDGSSYTIDLSTEQINLIIVDPDVDIVRVEPGTLINIRGCGDGNNQNQLELGANLSGILGTTITYTPRTDFIGRAQFGFYLHDGKERGSFMIYTIDVTTGSAFVNSSNSNTPTGAAELIVNGSCEQGTAVKAFPNSENNPYSIGYAGEAGREGEYCCATIFSDAHPLLYTNVTMMAGSSGLLIRNSFKACNDDIMGFYGDQRYNFLNPFTSPWDNPLPNNNIGDRYQDLNNMYNYFTLAADITSCKKYNLIFDINFDNSGIAIGDYFQPNKIGFTDQATYTNQQPINYNYTLPLQSIQVTGGWQTVSIPFYYCSADPGKFLNIESSGTLNARIYIDNISLSEEQTLPLTVDAGQDQVIYSLCPFGVTLNPVVSNEKCDLIYTWSPATGLSDPNIANPVASPQITTQYTVTVSDIFGCEVATDNVTVTVLPTPESNFSVTGLCQTSVTFIDLSGNNQAQVTYTWDFGDGTIISGIGDNAVNTSNTTGTYAEPIHVYNIPGNISVELTVSVGTCSAVSTLTISVIPSNAGYNNGCCSDGLTYDQNGDFPAQSGTWTYGIGNNPWDVTSPGPVLVKGTIRIPAGVNVIIENMTFEFDPNSKVIVEREGSLALNNRTIFKGLTSCSTMWQGVEVWGNSIFRHFLPIIGIPGSPPVPDINGQSMQGKLILSKGATIRDAHIGVLLGRTNICIPSQIPNPFPCKKLPYLLNYDGGILDADNAIFKQNAVAIKILPFHPSTGSYFVNYNASKIINSTITGGDLPDPGYSIGNPYGYEYPTTNIFCPQYANANTLGHAVTGIYQWNVRYVTIDNNIFGNTSINNLIEGIKSFDAPYNVSNSKFQNLDYGIRIFNTTSSLLGHKIYSNNNWNIGIDDGFKNIDHFYIQAAGSKFDYIKENTFGDINSSPVLPCTTFCNAGIHLKNTSNFNIIDNDFYYFTIGIMCRNSGSGSGVISSSCRPEGNKFTECVLDLVTIYNNGNLQYHCNSSDNQDPLIYNASLTGSPNFVFSTNWLNNGLLPTQGQYDNSVTATLPAGNQFIFSPSPTNKITNLTSASYKYYAHNTTDRIPSLTSPNWIIDFSSHAYNSATSCFSCNPSTNFNSTLKTDSTKISALQSELTAVVNNLDKGQTLQLLAAINSNMSEGNLKNKLLSASPLSDTVLITTINRTNQLSPGNFKNVIIPNSPVSDIVKVLLDNKISSLPPGIAKQISDAQITNNAYRTVTTISRELSAMESDYQLTLNKYIQNLISSDSLEKAMNLLDRQNDNETRQMLFCTFLADSNITEAQVRLNNFVPVTQEETVWKNLNTLLLSYAQAGETVFDMTASEETFIRSLANDNSGSLASTNAQAILRLVYGEEFEDSFIEFSSLKTQETISNLIIDTLEYLGNNVPNPFENTTIIPYQLPVEYKEVALNIFDITGKKIITIPLNSVKGIVKLSLDVYNAGVYLYNLEIDGMAVQTKRMVLIK